MRASCYEYSTAPVHGTALPRLAELADRATGRYHVTFVCGDDIPYDDTPDRSGAANRTEMQAWTLAELEARRVPFVLLRGSSPERVRAVSETFASRDD